MNEQTQLTPDQRENLVAYLDGELDEKSTEEIERLLAHSPAARQEVDLLTRTFALLDSLPRPEASTELTSKTLSSIRPEIPTPRWSGTNWYRHARRGIVAVSWMVGLMLAATTGYFAARHWRPPEDARLIRELPVIENLDTYRDVEDIRLLEEFAEHKVFEDDRSTDQP